MKKFRQTILILLVVCTAVFASELSGNNSLVLWYDTPGRHFTQSLVLGNGRLGMMVFGGIERDRIVLNEESVWSGSPADDNHPDAYRQLPVIQAIYSWAIKSWLQKSG